MRRASLPLILALALAPCGCGGPLFGPAGPPPAPVGDVAAEALGPINAARHRGGLAPLTLDPRLTMAAHAQAVDCALRDTLTHTGSDGTQPWDRIARAGYAWGAAGECAAAGQSAPAQAVADWLSDPPHRAILLSPQYTQMGAAAATSARGVRYYVADFGRPR